MYMFCICLCLLYVYIYIYVYIYTKLTYKAYKAYKKIRRATDTISHSSSEEKTFLMLLSGRCSPTLLVVSQLAQVHTPPQVIWITQSDLDFGLALFRRCQGYSSKQSILNYGIIMLSIHTGTISHSNYIITTKAYLLFSEFKIDNWERGWSQVTFLNMETPTNQF